MSLKSNSGTSTSDESTAKEDQVLVRSTSGSRKSNVESKVLVSRTKSANSKHLSDAKETHAVRLVISAPNGAESKNEKGRFNRQFQNIRKGTLSDIRSAVAPSGVQNKMMANREKVDFKLLAISVTIVVVFMTTFLPSVVVNLLPGSRNFDPRIHSLCSVITWFNSMVNPIIYCFL